MSTIKPTMLLVSSPWNGVNSFKLMPIDKDCPFNEGIFDQESKLLVMVSNTIKDSLHMLPKLDDNGDAEECKKPRPQGKRIKEMRIHLDTFTEHYIKDSSEIIGLIEMVAINADRFDFKKYVLDIVVPETPKIQLITP